MPNVNETRDALIAFSTAWLMYPQSKFDRTIASVGDVEGNVLDLQPSLLMDAAELLGYYIDADTERLRLIALSEQLAAAAVNAVAELIAAKHHAASYDTIANHWICMCGERLPTYDVVDAALAARTVIEKHIRVKTVEKMRELGLNPRPPADAGVWVEEHADGSVTEHRAELVGHECGDGKLWEKLVWEDERNAVLERHLDTCRGAEG